MPIFLVKKKYNEAFRVVYTRKNVKSNLVLVAVLVLAPVVQKVDNAIRWINHYPVYNAISFPNTYSLDSDLSGG